MSFELSTPDDWRFRGIVGAFWEELKIYDQLNWLYKTLPACTATVTVGMFDGCGDHTGHERQQSGYAQ